jgi:hypothetical protein
VPTRQYAFSVYSARKEGVASADHLWWYGALHVGKLLRNAADAVEAAVELRRTWIAQAQDYQARLAMGDQPDEAAIAKSRTHEELHAAQIPDIRRQGAELLEFIGQYDTFIAERDPWSEMIDDEIAVLEEVMKEARKSFPDLCTYRIPIKIDDVRDLSIRHMITGGPQALAALPDDMLAFMNERYRLTTQSPHQMFGLAGVKQSALYDHIEDLLLLQLSYDDMNEWKFGDMGLWHFWIEPRDAAASRWDQAKLTFECA